FDRMKMLIVEDKKICDEYLTAYCGVSKFLSIFFITKKPKYIFVTAILTVLILFLYNIVK
ncbi:MAG: hypothetical protein AABX65_02530, partial [Nanoarchaeota archaeon]